MATKTKADVDDRLRRELAGVAFATAGLLVLASLLLHEQGYHAYIPDAIARLLQLLLGAGAYVVGLMFLGLGAAAVSGRLDVMNARLFAGAGLFFACFLMACHAGVPRGAEFDPEALVHGGGVVGGALWWGASRIFGPVCTWIVMAAALLVAAILFTQGRAVATSLAISQSAVVGGRWLWGKMRTGAQGVAERRRSRPKPKPKQQSAHAGPVREQVLELDIEPSGPAEGAAADLAVEEPVADAAVEAPEPETTPVPGPPDLTQPLESSPAPPPAATRVLPAKRKRPVKPPVEDQLSLLGEDELYEHPPLALITKMDEDESKEDRREAESSIALLEDTLESFGITAKVKHYVRGPAVTRYEVEPVRGIRVNRIARLADDLALAFAAIDVRVEAPIPGKSLIGIEVPNQKVSTVGLRSILATDAYRKSKSLLSMAIGRDIAGTPVVTDLARMPHLLVAGATNSGKTVCLHSIITSLLMRARPEEVRLILIDPKRVELMLYDGIPHLMAPVVTTAPQAADVLRKTIREMERRYDMFAMKSVVNISEYNEFADMPKELEAEEFERLPFVVVIIDELADLMMQAKAEFEFSICRIAQLARATGIHLVIATQRPSVNVITGTIKANIPSRIALTVASIHDSRTIIDGQGAERLIGCGDMLFSPFDANKPRRVQGAFIPRSDLEKLVDHLRDQGEPSYDIIPEVKEETSAYAGESDPSDELYDAAVELVVAQQEASVSMLQRRFKIGYARAGRLIDMMEERRVAGPSEGSKPRKVLVPPGYSPGSYMDEQLDDGYGDGFGQVDDDGPMPDEGETVFVLEDGEEG